MKKKCDKGKSCGATCIDRGEICRKDLSDGTSGQMSKVSEKVSNKDGKSLTLDRLTSREDFDKKLASTKEGYNDGVKSVHQWVAKLLGEKILTADDEIFPPSYSSEAERQLFGKLRGSLSKGIGKESLPEVLKILRGLTDREYTEIRNAQLGGKTNPREVRKAELLEAFLSRKELNRPPVEKFRGVGVDDNDLSKMIEGARGGTRFNGMALSSWSTDLGTAKRFADDNDFYDNKVILRTINTKGVPIGGVSTSEEEYEVLTPRTANYRHLGYSTIKYVGETYRVIDLEEV